MYLYSSTQPILMDVLHQTLLIQHQHTILHKENTGLRAMLQANSSKDLTVLYQLYSTIPAALQPIASIVQQHILESGNALLSRLTSDEQGQLYITSLISLHTHYHELIRSCFHGHATLQRALKDAFESLLNKDDNAFSTAELLSNYSDDLLRKGGTQLIGGESELQATLDQIVRLFAYLSDKDMFSEFYRKSLATRLLTQRSASDDCERAMIGKLKLKCGAQFTSKFEGMINDMRNAQEHISDFKQFIHDRQIQLDGIDFTVQVYLGAAYAYIGEME